MAHLPRRRQLPLPAITGRHHSFAGSRPRLRRRLHLEIRQGRHRLLPLLHGRVLEFHLLFRESRRRLLPLLLPRGMARCRRLRRGNLRRRRNLLLQGAQGMGAQAEIEIQNHPDRPHRHLRAQTGVVRFMAALRPCPAHDDPRLHAEKGGVRPLVFTSGRLHAPTSTP